jgi:hypothetical protein
MSCSLVSTVNHRGWTALHQASHAGEEGVVEVLLEAKADVNAVCKDGCSAAMYASAQGWCDILQMLHASGANLDIKDRDKDTVLTVAADKKTKAFINNLRSSSSSSSTATPITITTTSGSDTTDSLVAGLAASSMEEKQDTQGQPLCAVCQKPGEFSKSMKKRKPAGQRTCVSCVSKTSN